MTDTAKSEQWVFLYGGQGAQLPGMGRDFADACPGKTFYREPYCCEMECDLLLDPGFTNIHETRYAQLALTLFSLSVTELLQETGFKAAAAVGLSAGEFPALALAGVYKPTEILQIVRRRAALMSFRLAERRNAGFCDGMLAVIGLQEETVSNILKDYPQVSPANMNAQTQLSLSGPRADLEALQPVLKNAGARRTVFLDVEGAFHSEVFAPDVENLREAFMLYEAGEAGIDLPLNILGRPLKHIDDPAERRASYADLMSRQMVSTTRLDDCFTYLLDQGYKHFVEIAPKAVLTPLLRRRDPALQLYHISDLDAFNRFVS